MSRYTTDARWKRVRRAKLRMTPTCERCPAPATDVHHVDELGLDGPGAYAIANTESLCHSCHSKTTARYGVGRRAPRQRPTESHPGLRATLGDDPLPRTTKPRWQSSLEPASRQRSRVSETLRAGRAG